MTAVMPAISLWQPWCSLMAEEIKWIETRPWAAHTDVIGQRMALAATGTFPAEAKTFLRDVSYGTDAHAIFEALRAKGHRIAWDRRKLIHDLPLGVVLCTAVLNECLLMVTPNELLKHEGERVLLVADDELVIMSADDHSGGLDVTDQRPFGAFGRERYAWLFSDVQRLLVPVPAKGRQKIWTWKVAA